MNRRQIAFHHVSFHFFCFNNWSEKNIYKRVKVRQKSGNLICHFLWQPCSKTFLRETGCLGNPYFFLTGCLDIQFFDSPPFLNTISQTTFGYLPLSLQHLCGLQDAIPFHWSSCAFHSTLAQGSRGFSQGQQSF